MKVTLDIQKRGGKTTYGRPGLNWSEHTDAVFEAVDALRDAVRLCQATAHDPHYGDREPERRPSDPSKPRPIKEPVPV